MQKARLENIVAEVAAGAQRKILQIYLRTKDNFSINVIFTSVNTNEQRIKINSPPLSKFNPVPVRKHWLKNGHQLCETISKNKIVISRIRKEDESYTSQIFN